MTMMSAKEFNAALKALGLSQQDAARLLDIDVRTCRKWMHGERTVSGPAKNFLRHLLAAGCTGEQALAIAQKFS